MLHADGFLIMFAVNDAASFKEVKYYLEQIQRVRDAELRTIPSVLLGNKTDVPSNEWQVTRVEAEALAKKYGIAYYETSAKNNSNVGNVIEEVTKMVLKYKKYKVHGKKEMKPNHKCMVM